MRVRIGGRRWAAIAACGALLGAGVVAAPFALGAQAPAGQCADVEVIGARGTTERPGFGVVLTPLARQLTRDLPQTVRTTPVDYPASFNYTASVRQGVAEVRSLLTDLAADCPDTTVVLMGYSQGADVMGDVLAGERGGQRLAPRLAERIGAVLLFGDPTFTAGEDFNVTTGRRSGVFPRGRGALDAFADRIQSYCNRNDRFCQGGTSLAAHINYAGFRDDAVDFVADRLG